MTGAVVHIPLAPFPLWCMPLAAVAPPVPVLASLVLVLVPRGRLPVPLAPLAPSRPPVPLPPPRTARVPLVALVLALPSSTLAGCRLPVAPPPPGSEALRLPAPLRVAVAWQTAGR